MSNSALTLSSLGRVRLLNTNCEIIQIGFGLVQLDVEMEHSLNFARQSKDEGASYDFYIDSETKVNGKSKGDEPVDIFTMSCRFRSDYNFVGEEKDYEILEGSIPEFNSQIYPTVRSHIINVLSLTGINPAFLPYSLQLETEPLGNLTK